MRFVLILLFWAVPLWADCPAVPDHRAELEALGIKLRAAETEADGQKISNEMWALWADAPDDAAQALLDKGMSRRASYDFLAAMEAFDRLVAYCPDYAEGYNQRAFVSFLRQDFAAALPDLNRALELNDKHIGALSGRALTHLGLGDGAAARRDLGKAVDMNPWLPERHLLENGAVMGDEL